MPKHHLLINKNGILLGRYGVSTYLIEYFNLEVNQAVPETLFKQIKKEKDKAGQIEFDGQSFPVSVEPLEDLYQITFLQKTSAKVA